MDHHHKNSHRNKRNKGRVPARNTRVVFDSEGRVGLLSPMKEPSSTRECGQGSRVGCCPAGVEVRVRAGAGVEVRGGGGVGGGRVVSITVSA